MSSLTKRIFYFLVSLIIALSLAAAASTLTSTVAKSESEEEDDDHANTYKKETGPKRTRKPRRPRIKTTPPTTTTTTTTERVVFSTETTTTTTTTQMPTTTTKKPEPLGVNCTRHVLDEEEDQAGSCSKENSYSVEGGVLCQYREGAKGQDKLVVKLEVGNILTCLIVSC